MTFYLCGHYYNVDTITPEEILWVKDHFPAKYNQYLRPKIIQHRDELTTGNHIYQIYYDENSKQGLDNGFIPYKNTDTHNFENDVILDIWRRRDWINANYVGVLSWRFKQKTGLTSSDLQLTKDIHYFNPINYEKHEHPFCRKGYGSIIDMCEIADHYQLFPFKLLDYPAKLNIWCNYWIVKPYIFDLYCTNYLSKAVEFFKDKEVYNSKEMHRGSNFVYSFTFFLEGLFSVFLQHENLFDKI